MEGWNAGVKYDTLTCGCESQVDCFRSRVNRKAYTTSSCGSRRSGLPSPLFPSGVPIVAATSPPPACGSKTVSVVSSRNVPTPVRRSPDMSSRHPGIGCSCFTSRATPIGITSPRHFCSHSLVSTSARLDHMKNTARPGNGCRCNFPQPSRLIVQNRPSISMRKVFFSDSTTSPRSLAQSGRTTVSTTHRSRGWYFRRSAA